MIGALFQGRDVIICDIPVVSFQADLVTVGGAVLEYEQPVVLRGDEHAIGIDGFDEVDIVVEDFRSEPANEVYLTLENFEVRTL